MHGIMEHDKGFVQADSTWHGLPQYVCIPERPISIKEAIEVSEYPIEKVQLLRANNKPAEAWEIVRTDTDSVLVPYVGERFSIIQNNHMVNRISESLLAAYPDLKIESVGTLFNGATFFLNLRVGEFRVKGDKSDTVTNLMYANPLGKGSYVACAHNTRIVCNNTERIAEAQGVANQSIRKFKHTVSATAKIDQHLIDLAELKLHLKRHEEKLNFLAEQEMDVEAVDAFLNTLFPEPKDDGRAKTIAINSKSAVLKIFDGIQTKTLNNPYTKYGLYQAYTDWVDHEKSSRNADIASRMYDGIMGLRADKKQTVLDNLIAA